jgi:TIR domain
LDGIFISYRRSDSQGEAGRLFDDLEALFGEHFVFMDVAAIEAGRDFRKAIEEGVTKCGVLLVVIGPEWVNAKDETGVRRLDNPADFVRIETAAALRRDIPVIPILVRAAKMPAAEQLPEDLKDLAYRNCVELAHTRWKSDVQLLVKSLRRLLGDSCQAGAGDASPAESSFQKTTGASMPQENTSAPIDPAVLQRVSRELGFYIGQIANIVVSRAASRCTSAEDLYREVAEEIDSPFEREKFLRNRFPAP